MLLGHSLVGKTKTKHSDINLEVVEIAKFLAHCLEAISTGSGRVLAEISFVNEDTLKLQ